MKEDVLREMSLRKPLTRFEYIRRDPQSQPLATAWDYSALPYQQPTTTFEVIKSRICSLRKPPSILSSLKANIKSMLSASDSGGGKGDIVYSLLLLFWYSAVRVRGVKGKRVFGFLAVAAWSHWAVFTDRSKLVSCLSPSLCLSQCQACQSSISHILWKSRLSCHSYYIYIVSEAQEVWSRPILKLHY